MSFTEEPEGVEPSSEPSPPPEPEGPVLEKLLLVQTPDVLVPELIARGEREIDAIAATGKMAAFAAGVEKAIAQAPKAPVAKLAAGLVQEKLQELAAAGTTFLLLAREMAQAKQWEVARLLARRGLENRSDHRFADLLINVLPKLATDEQRAETYEADLELCRDLCPEAPELLWYESREADKRGESHAAEVLAEKAFQGYIALGEAGLAEDPLLRALETDNRDVLTALIGTFPQMAKAGQKDLLEVTLDLSLARLREAGLIEELAASFKEILDKYEAPAGLRQLYVECLTDCLGGKHAVGGLVEASGLPDPAVPINEALRRLDKLTKLLPGTFLPGVHVLEREWGIGKLIAHDGKFLTIDFRGKPGHRMSLEIVERALVIAPENLVAVAWFDNPAALEKERDEDPVALVVRSVRQWGDEATYKQIKEVLHGSVVAAADWASWWKRARERAEKDPRIDHTHAFRDTVRLGSGKPEMVSPETFRVPPLDTRGGLKRAARTITRLLEQHPEADEAARRVYVDPLTMALPEERSAEARLSILPLLVRWAADRRSEWVAEATRCIEAGAAVTDLAELEAQMACLELALESELWQTAAGAALTSRYVEVREAAWEALRARSGRDLGHFLADQLASGLATNSAVLLVSQILEKWEELGPAGRPDPWVLFVAAAPALNPSAPTKTRETAEGVLRSNSPLAELLRDVAAPTGTIRLRFTPAVRAAGLTAAPLLEKLFTATGHLTLVDRLPGHELDEESGPLLPERDDRVTLMTRATYDVLRERLSKMREQLEAVLVDLKTARELGDISENADYDAARDQQGLLVSSIDTMQKAIQSASFIEDLEREDGAIRPGVEVTYRDSAREGERTVWLLGEGDSHWGPEVVSYRAPLGQAILGKREGDTVEMTVGEETALVEIVSVRTKLP